jgi:predicted CXXCH cytochrome family protein
MNRARSIRLSRALVLAVPAMLATGALLLAQVAQTKPTGQPETDQAPIVAQPAPPAATSQPASTTVEDAGEFAPEQRVLSGLIGSKHDFTVSGQVGRNLCLPCHTPHLVSAPPPRLDQRAATTQPLRPYEGLNVQLTGWSLLCLGCHDGVTAPDVYTAAHAVTITGQLANSRLGVRGLRSHPVGIRYPLAAEGYEPLAAVEAAGLMLPDGRIQCTTCHDAHRKNRQPKMLVISNEHSRVCLTCHRL